tara:strand:- start:1137 stop:1325 length:189 start_codon:yes stop_codon:yes gene_type:complete
MEYLPKPIDEVKYDIEIIKEKITNIENNIKVIKSISQDTRLLIEKYENKEPIKEIKNKGWFF